MTFMGKTSGAEINTEERNIGKKFKIYLAPTNIKSENRWTSHFLCFYNYLKIINALKRVKIGHQSLLLYRLIFKLSSTNATKRNKNVSKLELPGVCFSGKKRNSFKPLYSKMTPLRVCGLRTTETLYTPSFSF